MIALDLSKQPALGVGRKAIPQVIFTGNIDRSGITTMFFIIEEAKKTILNLIPNKCKRIIIIIIIIIIITIIIHLI